MTDLYVEERGSGEPAVVLVHAGIADLRMWDREFAALAGRRRVVRYDVRGFGRSPDPDGGYFDHEDLLGVLDAAGLDRAVLVGASNGGRIVLDTAVSAPDRVAGTVLLDPPVPGLPVPDDLAAAWDEEDEALTRGDVEAARAINLRLWVDGVGRAPDQVDPAVRARVAAWLDDLLPRQARQVQADAGEAQPVEPAVRDRLGEVTAPALVLVGEYDQPNMRDAAGYLAAHLPRARLEVIGGAAHLPSVEQPERVAALLENFLAGVP